MREYLNAGSCLTGKKCFVKDQPFDGLGEAGHSESNYVLWKAGGLLAHTGAGLKCVGPVGQGGEAASVFQATAPFWQR